MQRITSVSNPKVKYARSLGRRQTRYEEGCFLVEGRRLIADAIEAGARFRMAFWSDAFADSYEGATVATALQSASQEAFAASEAVLKALSGTVTPQGAVAVAEMPPWPPLKSLQCIGLILDQWQDPGNLGTALRTAGAAGADWVTLTPGSVDPFSPKVVRAGMGAHFRVPIYPDCAWEEIVGAVSGVQIYLADAHGHLNYDTVNWCAPSALIVGGEAHGPGAEARQIGAREIAIPMAERVESLNAAVATSVILMEAARQRRHGGC
jgi:TrmH family RNA methyltransferase